MRKISWGEKLSFGAGAFGKDLVYGVVATFIFVYFTDVCLIAPAIVGTIFFVARIFDAVNDPIMGLVVDNTRSRFGKFKPWLVIGTLLNAVVLIFLYWKWDLSPNGMIIYAAVTYILWGLTYTIMDIPYWSMIPDLGSTVEERNQISAIPRLFASAAGAVIGGCGLWVVYTFGKENIADGYRILGISVSILFILFVGITVWRVRAGYSNPGTEQRKLSVKDMVRVLVKNDQVMCVLFISVLYNLMLQFNGGVAIYFFKDVVNNPDLIPYFLPAGSLGQVVGIFCYPFLNRFIARKKILIMSAILNLSTCAVIFFVNDFGIISAISASAFMGIGGGLMATIATVMLADGVDYGAEKFGVRNESIIFSTQTFVVKLASALSGFIIGIGLNLARYIPNEPLSSQGKLILKGMMAGMPIIMIAGYVFIYFKFYKPTKVQQAGGNIDNSGFGDIPGIIDNIETGKI